MKTFKIIGVRPLKGCNKHVIKNLKSDTFYTFYNNYEFKDEKVIKSEQQVPDNLYASNISLHAIVGMNGSGKSTMLKTIAGVLKPTTGKVEVCGTVAPLIELGAGFDMDLTARENVFLNGALLGYGREEMEKHYDNIVEFSELQNFMDVPVKNFSSGMVSRLAFAIATIGTPDILIVDEVLSVGDFRFQQKCEERIRKMMEHGTTILFVSHSIAQVESLCEKIVWLEHGHVKRFGDADEICKEYSQS